MIHRHLDPLLILGGLCRTNLSVIHWDCHTQGTHTHTRNESPTQDVFITTDDRAALYNYSNAEDNNVDQNSVFPRYPFRQNPGVNCSSPGPEFKNSYYVC